MSDEEVPKGTKTVTLIQTYDKDGNLLTVTHSTVIQASPKRDEQPWPGMYL